MSTIIRKGTKYYPIILENKGAYVFGTLCAVQIVFLKKNVMDLERRFKKIKYNDRGMSYTQ